ncbi:MAG: hypothetical protein EBS86_17700 [Crocinitomicaceae bacterium]|nr:hypothetical protein [Crocinitomicaceae bacterium]
MIVWVFKEVEKYLFVQIETSAVECSLKFPRYLNQRNCILTTKIDRFIMVDQVGVKQNYSFEFFAISAC